MLSWRADGEGCASRRGGPLLRDPAQLGGVVALRGQLGDQSLVVGLGNLGRARHDPDEVTFVAADDGWVYSGSKCVIRSCRSAAGGGPLRRRRSEGARLPKATGYDPTRIGLPTA